MQVAAGGGRVVEHVDVLRKCFGWFVVFFFQAEDGIRDLYVTGVQTCALPISLRCSASKSASSIFDHFTERGMATISPVGPGRSEERRVGKECRSRWSPYH